MAWKGLFQHLEGPLTNDYHEFRCAHEIHIEEWQVYWCINYVSSLRELWPQVVQWQLSTLI